MNISEEEVKKVQEQLAQMLELDQKVREEPENGEWDGEAIRLADTENTSKLKKLIEKYGWITISQFGEESATAAWFIVQHADLDLEFQKKCLELISKLPESEVSKHDIAYLTDRILVAEGKLQRYGTQYEDFDDYVVIRPVENMEELDNLRVSMGLETVSEYIELVKEAIGQNMFLTKDEVPVELIK